MVLQPEEEPIAGVDIRLKNWEFTKDNARTEQLIDFAENANEYLQKSVGIAQKQGMLISNISVSTKESIIVETSKF